MASILKWRLYARWPVSMESPMIRIRRCVGFCESSAASSSRRAGVAISTACLDRRGGLGATDAAGRISLDYSIGEVDKTPSCALRMLARWNFSIHCTAPRQSRSAKDSTTDTGLCPTLQFAANIGNEICTSCFQISYDRLNMRKINRPAYMLIHSCIKIPKLHERLNHLVHPCYSIQNGDRHDGPEFPRQGKLDDFPVGAPGVKFCCTLCLELPNALRLKETKIDPLPSSQSNPRGCRLCQPEERSNSKQDEARNAPENLLVGTREREIPCRDVETGEEECRQAHVIFLHAIWVHEICRLGSAGPTPP